MTPAGTVCLQGGREFGADCLPMDAAVLDAAGPGPVVVLASAARPGSDYAGAGANAARHYRAAGATDVGVAPDPREDAEGARAAVAGARVVVLPGGSPSSLHRAVVGTPVGDALLGVLAAGGAVMGSSAGAMVLCGLTVLPDEGRRVVTGLGVVADALALVHWGGPGAGWEGLAPPGSLLLGLPEASGLLLQGGTATAVGVGASGARVGGAWRILAPGESLAWPPGE